MGCALVGSELIICGGTRWVKGEGGEGGREGGEGGRGGREGRGGGREGGRGGRERGEERREGEGRERERKGEGRRTGFGHFFFLSTYTCTLYSPIEIERGGRKREILHDHNDMYILHFCKNLIT